ncbi:MAG: DUF3090 family protein [Acidimicrobiales bacterium]|nr:DUF3090 family protein [Acidimicrobiales bacterium]
MTSKSFDLGDVAMFTVGAIGEPGQRLFYFQAFGAGTEVCIKCEKVQALTLATQLMTVIPPLPSDAEEVAPAEALEPNEVLWPTGSINVRANSQGTVLILEFIEFTDPDDLDIEPATLEFRVTPDQIRAFVAQAGVLASASRPICRLCEHPIDPSGHACPRLN